MCLATAQQYVHHAENAMFQPGRNSLLSCCYLYRSFLLLFLRTFFWLCVALWLSDWLDILRMVEIFSYFSLGDYETESISKNLEILEKLYWTPLMSVWQMFRWVIFLGSFLIHELSFSRNQWASYGTRVWAGWKLPVFRRKESHVSVGKTDY